MRNYYVFKVKNEFVRLYHERPNSLFEILKQLYSLKKNDLDYGVQVFSSLTEKIDKEYLNKKIFLKYHNEMIYTRTDTEHIINNLYKDEISILTIKNVYMLLTTNHNFSSFFNILLDYQEDLFICDFENFDYFFLNDIKVLV